MRQLAVLLLLLITFVGFVGFTSDVSASRPEFSTAGQCEIGGVVRSANFKEAFEDACVKDFSCPVGAYSPVRPAMYQLVVLIESVSCEGVDDQPHNYSSQFPLNAEVLFYVDPQLLNLQTPQVGSRVKGTSRYSHGHWLSPVKLLTSAD